LIQHFIERIFNMHALTQHEVLAVSGGEDEALLEPHYYSDPFIPPALRHPADPLPPVRREPVSRNPLP
jgi:hypothetical protein